MQKGNYSITGISIEFTMALANFAIRTVIIIIIIIILAVKTTSHHLCMPRRRVIREIMIQLYLDLEEFEK